MKEGQLAAQALALQSAADTMVKSGAAGTPVEAATRAVVEALVKAAQELRRDNPVVMAVSVRLGITWSEVLTIAAVIYTAF